MAVKGERRDVKLCSKVTVLCNNRKGKAEITRENNLVFNAEGVVNEQRGSLSSKKLALDAVLTLKVLNQMK